VFSLPLYKEYKEHLVYSNQYYEEEFYWPSKPYILNVLEIKKIREHFSVTENISETRLSIYIYDFYML